MVSQTILAYWFTNKFGLQLESLSVVFFLSHILTATSIWIAAKLSNSIGLLNTMVFTHIPSALFMIAMTFAPTLWMAVVFFQFRAFLSQMDVAPKQSYTMAVVGPA